MFDSADKKHPASAQKRRRVREEGGVARSRDLSSQAVLVIALAVLWWSGPHLVSTLKSTFDVCFASPTSWTMDAATIADLLTPLAAACLRGLLPLLACICIASCLSTTLQHGYLFSPKPLFDWNRIQPMHQLGKLMSTSVLDQLGLTLLRVVGAVTAWLVSIRMHWAHLRILPSVEIVDAAHAVWTIGMQTCFSIAAVLLVISLLDYWLQYWRFEQSLRMTDEEVREENRSNPQPPRARQTPKPTSRV